MVNAMTPTQISSTTDEIMYLAFRAAFITTFERTEAEYSVVDSAEASGFLDRLPLAKGIATHVQLDLLLQAWARVSAGDNELSVVDQCVCYCATDELAMIGLAENHRSIAQICNGPKTESKIDPLWLASKLRTVQITWPFPVDSALLLRDFDFLTTDLDHRPRTFSVAAATEILDEVGSWLVNPSILSNTKGLLTLSEQERLGCFFQQHPRLMNL